MTVANNESRLLCQSLRLQNPSSNYERCYRISYVSCFDSSRIVSRYSGSSRSLESASNRFSVCGSRSMEKLQKSCQENIVNEMDCCETPSSDLYSVELRKLWERLREYSQIHKHSHTACKTRIPVSSGRVLRFLKLAILRESWTNKQMSDSVLEIWCLAIKPCYTACVLENCR